MKQTILIALVLLTAACGNAFGQVCAGVKLGTDIGLEAGVIIADRFCIKAYSTSDYITALLLIDKKNNSSFEGNRYHLSYGAGLGVRIKDPVWILLDVGYGFGGSYTIDPVYDRRARKNNIQGIEVGIEGQWYFSDSIYISAGYFTIPAGFSFGKPVHSIMASIGFRL